MPPAPPVLAPPDAPEILEPAHGFTTTDDSVHLRGTAPGADEVQVLAPGVILDVDVAADGTFATDIDLPDETEYTIRVRALNSAGRSDWADVTLTREPLGAPPAKPGRGARRPARPAPIIDDDEEERHSWWTPIRILLVALAVIIGIPLLILFFLFVAQLFGRVLSHPAALPAAANAGITAQVPAAPTGLTATPGANQVVLSWQAPSGNVTSYLVKRNGQAVGTPNGTSFTDTNVVPGTAYQYTVQALGPSGAMSDPSSSVSATPQVSASSNGSGSAAGSVSSGTQTPAAATGPVAINQPQGSVTQVMQITGTGGIPTGDVVRLFVFSPGEGLYHPQDVAQATASGWSAQAYIGSSSSCDNGSRYTLFAVELTPAQNDAVSAFHNHNLDAGYNSQQWSLNFAPHVLSRTSLVRSGTPGPGC